MRIKYDLNDLCFKVNKLCSAYLNKYGQHPTHILIDERTFTYLEFAFRRNQTVMEGFNNEPCEFVGLKIIPIKHGDIQVLELVV